MVARARSIEYVVTSSETEALLLEDNFIKEARPPFNLRLRDDKSYPFIEITLSDEWPRVRFFRGRHAPGNLYFGPYSSARKVRETLELIGRIFPYRKCRADKPGRPSGSPCLQYFIDRSLGPCDDRVSRDEYLEVIDQVIEFLRGRLSNVGRSIEEDMRAAATAREFEKAALLRDRLEAVRHVQERQSVESEGSGSFDVLGLWQGEPGGNVQVFRVREGALVARETFFVENTAGREPRDLIEEFAAELLRRRREHTGPGDRARRRGRRRPRRRAVGAARRARRGAPRAARTQAPAARDGRAQRRAGGRRRRGAPGAHPRGARRGARAAARRPGPRPTCRCASSATTSPTWASATPWARWWSSTDGRPRKAHYRKFTIRTVAGQDDFAMMREVVGRRLRRLAASGVAAGGRDGAADAAARGAAGDEVAADGGAIAELVVADEGRYDESFAARPGLIVVDGGKGQLSAALEALREHGVDVPVIGLAKQREEVFVPGRSEPLALPADDPASLLLQRIRDEAHRFAVTFHRQRRGTDLRRASIFDELPKVGPVRRRAILEHFGSPERFIAASRDELEQVPGLPRRVAREIYGQLHKAG